MADGDEREEGAGSRLTDALMSGSGHQVHTCPVEMQGWKGGARGPTLRTTARAGLSDSEDSDLTLGPRSQALRPAARPVTSDLTRGLAQLTSPLR